MIYEGGPVPSLVPEPTEDRWLVDEMLGRLARFLRILGYDTEYVRGLSDDAIRARALDERRTLLTRDGALAARTPQAFVILSTDLRKQLRELWGKYPHLLREPRFDRCTKCNGKLAPLDTEQASAAGVPGLVVRTASFGSMYRCTRCGQAYWEGSHTEKIRTFLREASQAETP